MSKAIYGSDGRAGILILGLKNVSPFVFRRASSVLFSFWFRKHRLIKCTQTKKNVIRFPFQQF